MSAQLLTVGQVAELLQMSPAFVRHHASGFRQPVLPSVKLGRSVRFELGDVEEFIKGHRRV